MAARPGREGRKDWSYERVLETFPRLKERLGNLGALRAKPLAPDALDEFVEPAMAAARRGSDSAD